MAEQNTSSHSAGNCRENVTTGLKNQTVSHTALRGNNTFERELYSLSEFFIMGRGDMQLLSRESRSEQKSRLPRTRAMHVSPYVRKF